MDGGDRAGYKQISGCIMASLVGPSTGSTDWTSGDWADIEVISSAACFAGIVAPGLTGSSKITSATSFPMGSKIACNNITQVKLSSDSTGHCVILHNRAIR